jgi:hypothetical protein
MPNKRRRHIGSYNGPAVIVQGSNRYKVTVTLGAHVEEIYAPTFGGGDPRIGSGIPEWGGRTLTSLPWGLDAEALIELPDGSTAEILLPGDGRIVGNGACPFIPTT